MITKSSESFSDFDADLEHLKAVGLVESRLKTLVQNIHQETKATQGVLLDPHGPYSDGPNKSVFIVPLPMTASEPDF